MYEKTVLGNGVRVLTSFMPQVRSVSVCVLLGVGSRYEDDAQAGVSHFIEHLLFKGTERRPQAKDIAETIEGVGGILNGGTDKEITVYWSKVAREHFPLAFDLLVDMLLYSRFDPAEMEKERRVIQEEIGMIKDSPRQQCHVLIDQVVWPDQALGRDVAGSLETLSSLDREKAMAFWRRMYVPSNMVVCVAGSVTHAEVVAQAERLLRMAEVDGSPQSWFPAVDKQDSPRHLLESRKTEQAHFCLAVRGLSLFHPDRFILGLLSTLLGEGMSSRLFLELREKKGLAYEVHSFVTHFLDSGALTVYAGVEPGKLDAALETILKEMRRLKEEPVPPEELTKAKELSKGRLLLRMEDTRSVAGWVGAQELLLERVYTLDEILAIIEGITGEDIQRVARGLLMEEKLNLAVVGPFRSGHRFPLAL